MLNNFYDLMSDVCVSIWSNTWRKVELNASSTDWQLGRLGRFDPYSKTRLQTKIVPANVFHSRCSVSSISAGFRSLLMCYILILPVHQVIIVTWSGKDKQREGWSCRKPAPRSRPSRITWLSRLSQLSQLSQLSRVTYHKVRHKQYFARHDTLCDV